MKYEKVTENNMNEITDLPRDDYNYNIMKNENYTSRSSESLNHSTAALTIKEELSIDEETLENELKEELEEVQFALDSDKWDLLQIEKRIKKNEEKKKHIELLISNPNF